MAEDSAAEQARMINRFIELANELRNAGQPVAAVNQALMSASAVYAGFAAAGNDGFLQDSGVDKVAQIYRQQLMHAREARKAELRAAGKYQD